MRTRTGQKGTKFSKNCPTFDIIGLESSFYGTRRYTVYIMPKVQDKFAYHGHRLKVKQGHGSKKRLSKTFYVMLVICSKKTLLMHAVCIRASHLSLTMTHYHT